MRIVVAPDKFKGTLTAVRAAEAIARGARKVYPHASFALRPLADGGEGTVDAFVTARGARILDVPVTGPLGEELIAPLALLETGDAVVEMSAASGLAAVAEPGPRSALNASSIGTGQLLVAALERQPARVIVGVGGSASTDGGTGAATATGWRFLDSHGRDLTPGGGSLVELHAIEPPASRPSTAPTVIAACDVDNPLVGARGAARVFSPQKGAVPDEVVVLERGLERLAEIIRRDLGIDVAALEHGGAGGGMGAGLSVFFTARLASGFDLLAELVDLDDDLAGADMVITGEGRMDPQSLAGKAPVALARRAVGHKVPVVAVVGDLALTDAQLHKCGIDAAIGVKQSGGGERAAADPAGAVELAIAGLLSHRLENARGAPVRKRSRFLRI